MGYGTMKYHEEVCCLTDFSGPFASFLSSCQYINDNNLLNLWAGVGHCFIAVLDLPIRLFL